MENKIEKKKCDFCKKNVQVKNVAKIMVRDWNLNVLEYKGHEDCVLEVKKGFEAV